MNVVLSGHLLHRLFLATAMTGLVGVVACVGQPAYSCTNNTECVNDTGANGICEITQTCSFPDLDPACSSTGRKYPDTAGDKANQCVVADSSTASCIKELAAGADHFCAIRSSDSTVWCWGLGVDGELGNGANKNSPVPVQVQLPLDSSGLALTAVHISAAETHTCMSASDGSVWCWGANDQGQLGVRPDQATQGSPTPVQVYAPRATSNHVCTGSADCSGTGNICKVVTASASFCTQCVTTSDCKLGDQCLSSQCFHPFGASLLSSGGKHSCAIGGTDGLGYCWGENTFGQTSPAAPDYANGSVQAAPIGNPDQVPTLPAQGVTTICAGDEYSAAVVGGRVFLWGDNGDGEFGIGTKTSPGSSVANPLANAAGITDVEELSCGDESICAKKKDGALSCWGNNDQGQLGDGSTATATSAETVNIAAGVQHILVGSNASGSCAIDSTSALFCWGRDDFGQIGNGQVAPAVAKPATVALATVTTVAISSRDTCALTFDGQLWCWGANDDGQLANGTIGTASSFTPSPGRSKFPCK